MTTQSRGDTCRDAPPRIAFRFSPQRRRSGPALVYSHEPAITRHVGGEDGDEAAL